MKLKEEVICEVLSLYRKDVPIEYHTIDTSHGEDDFRQAIFVEWPDLRSVIKIASNGFTTPHRVQGWYDTILKYREMGYYCPAIVPTLNGNVAAELTIDGKPCVVYAEEFSAVKTAEQWGKDVYRPYDRYVFHDDVFRFLGKVGSAHLTTADFPSGYCILEGFAPGEEDEIFSNAVEVKEILDSMPQYRERVAVIWQTYLENKAKLEGIYPKLPTSVFQADPNWCNVLLDEKHRFAGLLDFNLCGQDTVMNVLFRDSFTWFYEDVFHYVPTGSKYSDVFYLPEMNQRALNSLFQNIRLTKETYAFSKEEIEAALLIYRYMRPLSWAVRNCLSNHKDDANVIEIVLDWIEQEQCRDIDFASIMQG